MLDPLSDQSEASFQVTWSLSDQSEASIQVTWSLSTNQYFESSLSEKFLRTRTFLANLEQKQRLDKNL